MSVCIFYNSFPWGTLFPVSLLRLHSFPSLPPLPSASILWSLELQMAFICSHIWFIRRTAWQIRLLVLFYVPPPSSCLTCGSPRLLMPCLWGLLLFTLDLPRVRCVQRQWQPRILFCSEFVKAAINSKPCQTSFWSVANVLKPVCMSYTWKSLQAFIKSKYFKNLKLCRTEKRRNWGSFCFVFASLLTALIP